jgi:hypothetical protein
MVSFRLRQRSLSDDLRIRRIGHRGSAQSLRPGRVATEVRRRRGQRNAQPQHKPIGIRAAALGTNYGQNARGEVDGLDPHASIAPPPQQVVNLAQSFVVGASRASRSQRSVMFPIHLYRLFTPSLDESTNGFELRGLRSQRLRLR